MMIPFPEPMIREASKTADFGTFVQSVCAYTVDYLIHEMHEDEPWKGRSAFGFLLKERDVIRRP